MAVGLVPNPADDERKFVGRETNENDEAGVAMGSAIDTVGASRRAAAGGQGPGALQRILAVRHSTILRMVTRRLAMGAVLIFVVTALSFVLASLTPGDTARQLLGPDATQEQYEALRQSLGLDLPLYEQYWNWLSSAVTGDLGVSIYGSEEVVSTVAARLPVTLWLITGALIVSLVIGVTFGVISALRGGVLGRALDGIVMLAYSVPSFWLGAVLASVLAVGLGWFPATGYVPFAESPVDWARSLVLPVAALSAYGVAMIAKQTRDAMLDVLGSEYLRMARASGISPVSLIARHALRNASVRVVTVVGILAVGLLGGTVVIETVFALPGMGSLIVEATTRRDLPVVQGVVVYFTVMVVLINLVVDLLYIWLNPKVRNA